VGCEVKDGKKKKNKKKKKQKINNPNGLSILIKNKSMIHKKN
jgi:hypothetical protein